MLTRASASTGAALDAFSNKGILTIQRLPALLIERITPFVIISAPHFLMLSNNLANRNINRFNKNKN
jgi:hypothetical protein